LTTGTPFDKMKDDTKVHLNHSLEWNKSQIAELSKYLQAGQKGIEADRRDIIESENAIMEAEETIRKMKNRIQTCTTRKTLAEASHKSQLHLVQLHEVQVETLTKSLRDLGANEVSDADFHELVKKATDDSITDADFVELVKKATDFQPSETMKDTSLLLDVEEKPSSEVDDAIQ